MEGMRKSGGSSEKGVGGSGGRRQKGKGLSILKLVRPEGETQQWTPVFEEASVASLRPLKKIRSPDRLQYSPSPSFSICNPISSPFSSSLPLSPPSSATAAASSSPSPPFSSRHMFPFTCDLWAMPAQAFVGHASPGPSRAVPGLVRGPKFSGPT